MRVLIRSAAVLSFVIGLAAAVVTVWALASRFGSFGRAGGFVVPFTYENRLVTVIYSDGQRQLICGTAET